MYIHRKLIVILSVLVFIGCSYTVTPKPDPGKIYNPFVRSYPYKAALILDDHFQRTYYELNIGGDTASHIFVPALKKELTNSLGYAFNEVVVLQGISKKLFDKEKIDIAIYPQIIDFNVILPLHMEGMLGTYTSYLQLDINVHDWDGNAIDKFRIKGEGVREGTNRPQTPWGYKKDVKSGEYDPEQHRFAHNQWQVASRAIEDCCSKLLEQIKGSPTIQDYFTWLRETKIRMAQPKKIEIEKQSLPVAKPTKPVEKETKQSPRQPEKQDEKAVVLE